MPNMIEDVYAFQTTVLKNEFPDKPKLLKESLLTETIVCLEEEIEELGNADTLSEQADALVDLMYFTLGALHQMGVDTERVWKEVHRANISKVRGKTKRGHDNDATKPDDWKAPDHSWLDEAA